MPRPLASLVVALVAAAVALGAGQAPGPSLGAPETVAPGIELFRLADPSLLSPPGVVAVQLLRVDPARVTFRLALAQDTVLGSETVSEMARRADATAAINAGFFLPTGEPAGLMKIGGELVSDAVQQRGAVAFLPGRFGRAQRLLFDQVSARVIVEFGRRGQRQPLAVDAVDTVRGPGALVLFTPRFWTDTRTPCDGGTEWVIEGRPLLVTERRVSSCTSAIPRDGAVLAAGPEVPKARLEPAVIGRRGRVTAVYTPVNGTEASDWNRAPDVIGGVGLLMLKGKPVTDWSPEKPRDGFATERHPRTVIGVARDGRVWLIAVDGRNPARSLGMNFAELQALAQRIGLVDALNLDGGGSTTMVARGSIVNQPSDAAGPRKVSDAILVTTRGRR